MTKTRKATRARKAVEIIPYAPRLSHSLRDEGHDFVTAVADLVDNSIEFGATVVDLQVEFNGNNSWIRIADNGEGMTAKEIIEAMRYGSRRSYDKDALGKFGLGLNLASMSQCQKMSVASRSNPDRISIIGYCWDQEFVDKTRRWLVYPLERSDVTDIIRAPLKSTTGTVVLWERLDRILGYTSPYGEFARKKLASMSRELEKHLAMVFHRFISGETHRRKLKIILNGNLIKPWDPFARNEPKTKVLEPINIPLEYEGSKGEIRIQPYILPPQSGFSSPEAFRDASGPANWNQQQGFYFYRSDRLVQAGGWCRLRTIDEHTKLARVAILFPPKLDEAFKINISKTRVQLPYQIREQVAEEVKSIVKIARDIYDKSERRPVPPSMPIGAAGTPTSSTNVGAQQGKPSDITMSEQPVTQQSWTLDDIQNKLEDVATAAEKPVIQTVCNRFREQISIQEHS
ncbi:MAG: ATP-binding protein [Dehalococcoidia bacterium]|jgi:anti-sigma regulatory factor (Ser/Thr protein kinase)